MKLQGVQTSEMVSWLRSMGCETSEPTLKRRFRDWGVRRNTYEPVTDHLISRIKDLYRHNLLSDMEIAKKIADQDGLHRKEEALL